MTATVPVKKEVIVRFVDIDGKRKRTNSDLQNTTQKAKIEQHELTKNGGELGCS
jgi:hypothetical protein